ncbi:APC family permease [Mycoplasmopsis gallopavonis]|uniref:Amino acid permease n=1 Tax=Mycoplasmopsis gallopavonis TaxID=76629 RepID=A0A449B0C2_9BACT|nr:amino acid permease [Mycoplasmopsis gallopavonis]RIV16560.1 amino acid permease [Mycoplasmopsis gallopavonis]VEU73241.1 Amino acid permease [Mycoplasmopsis gallopavonis]
MKKQKVRKIGFFASLAISVSSVIGIGIFFKNISIFKNQVIASASNPPISQFSIYSFLLVWILGGLISLLTAYCFIQVGKSHNSKSGLAGWIRHFSSPIQGNIAKVAHAIFYYGILCSILPILSTEMIFQAVATIRGISVEQIPFIYVVLTGIFVYLAILAINFLALNVMVAIQKFSFFFKIVPLAIAIIIAFVGSATNPTINTTTPNLGTEYVPSTHGFNWSGLFLSLPIVLFAFDSFLSIGNLASDMAKPKQIPLVSVLTIVIAAVIYFLISLGVGLTGYPNVVQIFSIIVKNKPNLVKGLQIAIYLLLGVSGYFVCNSISLATLRSHQALVEEKQILGYQWLHKLNLKKSGLGGLVLQLIFYFGFILIVGLISIFTKQDSILDALTNLPVTIFFLVYAYAIFLAWKDSIKQQKEASTIFKIVAPITILLIAFIMGFDLFYKNLYLLIQKQPSNSGVFYPYPNWTYFIEGIIFWTVLAIFIIFLVLNYFIVRKNHKKEQWQDFNSLAFGNFLANNNHTN